MTLYKRRTKKHVPREKRLSRDPTKRQHQLNNLLKSPYRNPSMAERSRLKQQMKAIPDSIIKWAQKEFYIPETHRAIQLLDWEKEWLVDLLHRRRKITLALLGTPKKCGKSTLAAVVSLYLLCKERFAEIYIVGPDIEQSQLVVYSKIRTCIRLNERLRKTLKVTKTEILNEKNNSFIRPLACSSTNAGLNPRLCIFDELWRFSSDEAKMAYDELTNIPAKHNLNLIVTYAGFSEDEDSILWQVYNSGIKQLEGKEEKDEAFLFRWYNEELYQHIPWVTTRYLSSQQRRLRRASYDRLHKNLWVSGTEVFVDQVILDSCTTTEIRKGIYPNKPAIAAIDIGLKSDCSAITIVGQHDTNKRKIRLVDHKIFIPTHHQTIDLETTVERVMLEFDEKYQLVAILYDPWQFARSAATLKKQGLKMVEFVQSPTHLSEMSSGLSSLLTNSTLLLYRDQMVRQHLLNARCRETERGWKLIKQKAAKKIDLAVSLAMSAYEAQQRFLVKPHKKGKVYCAGMHTPVSLGKAVELGPGGGFVRAF